MMKYLNLNKLSIALFLILLMLMIGGFFHLKSNQTKTAFIDLGKVFYEFQYTKEVKAELDTKFITERNIIDSLDFEIKKLQSHISEESNNIGMLNEIESLFYMSEQYKNLLAVKQDQFIENSNDAIWIQINQYVIEYAEMKSYDLIFGSSGNGSIMYGADYIDITSEVIDFINKKYNGE